MSLVERKHRQCLWCKVLIGFTRKEYCSPACKQKAYRYRKRGHVEARVYRKWALLEE